MDTLVINYTDWIGYHVVESLLNEGYYVYGVEKEEGNPHVKDFFVRNSNFKQIDQQENRIYSNIICIGDQKDVSHFRAERYFLINAEQVGELSDLMTIQTPFLFGEFMPMDEHGFYEGKKYVAFASEEFKENAIYIADFLEFFIEWVQSPPEFNTITVKSGKNRGNETVILENFFFIHENMPIGTQMKKIVEHYKKHSILYPERKED